MKKTILFFTLLTAYVSVSMAQQNEFEYLKSEYKSDRKTLLMNYLKLSDADAAKFWPIYGNYEAERSKLADARFQNMKNYAAQYSTLTNEQADVFGKNYFENQATESSIEKKYYAQIKKQLGGKIALSWLQFEAYIDAATQFKLLDAIPFTGGK
ncbi:MAG: hypothetical protein K1X61_07810 [Chitinophagales bacterium]|nr:hypothetical protein [Chitinophagales bacterium]